MFIKILILLELKKSFLGSLCSFLAAKVVKANITVTSDLLLKYPRHYYLAPQEQGIGGQSLGRQCYNLRSTSCETKRMSETRLGLEKLKVLKSFSSIPLRKNTSSLTVSIPLDLHM